MKRRRERGDAAGQMDGYMDESGRATPGEMTESVIVEGRGRSFCPRSAVFAVQCKGVCI